MYPSIAVPPVVKVALVKLPLPFVVAVPRLLAPVQSPLQIVTDALPSATTWMLLLTVSTKPESVTLALTVGALLPLHERLPLPVPEPEPDPDPLPDPDPEPDPLPDASTVVLLLLLPQANKPATARLTKSLGMRVVVHQFVVAVP